VSSSWHCPHWSSVAHRCLYSIHSFCHMAVLGLLDLEDEGTMALWNIRNCPSSTWRHVP